MSKLTGKALQEYQQTITLNAEQKEVIVGTLLGDACIPLDRGQPALRVEFEQNIARAKYIQHLYDIFHNFVSTPPKVLHHRGGQTRAYQSMRFRTYSHIDFKFYDDLFYTVDENKRRKKRVPENIHELLTARALAYWFMDDGNSYQNGRRRAYRFNTQGFLLDDQKRLIQALSHNLGIHATIQNTNHYYRIYIRAQSTNRFLDWIRPYVHPCFDYKIQNNIVSPRLGSAEGRT